MYLHWEIVIIYDYYFICEITQIKCMHFFIPSSLSTKSGFKEKKKKIFVNPIDVIHRIHFFRIISIHHVSLSGTRRKSIVNNQA